MTDEAKALVERLRAFDYNVDIAMFYDKDPECVSEAADRIEALEAEVERLNSLINATANHWLDLQHDHPIAWEGAVDAAMEAACDEIRRLSAALEGDSHDQ